MSAPKVDKGKPIPVEFLTRGSQDEVIMSVSLLSSFVYHLMATSIRMKFPDLRAFFFSRNILEVVALTKTWLNASDFDSEVAMEGYEHFHMDGPGNRRVVE